jgi:hypothetical protein
MTKEELIKDLEELRGIKNYSQSELLNTGYRTAMLDALDLVNKYFDLAPVVGRSEQLPRSSSYEPCEGCDISCPNWMPFFCDKK